MIVAPDYTSPCAGPSRARVWRSFRSFPADRISSSPLIQLTSRRLLPSLWRVVHRFHVSPRRRVGCLLTDDHYRHLHHCYLYLHLHLNVLSHLVREASIWMASSRMLPRRSRSCFDRILDRPWELGHDPGLPQLLRVQRIRPRRSPVRITVRLSSSLGSSGSSRRADGRTRPSLPCAPANLTTGLSRCSCDSAYRNNLGASVSNDQCNYACPGTCSWTSPSTTTRLVAD